MFFLNNSYNVIAEYTDSTSLSPLGAVEGEQSKTCRFCGKDDRDVTFNQRAHAISESLGNKNIISHYECDDCNAHFGKFLENDLGKSINPLRAAMKVKGKKGAIQHSQGVKIHSNDNEISFSTSDLNRFDYNQETGTFIINPKTQKYIPVAAYKALIKMAITIAPCSAIDDLKWAIDWVNEKEHTCAFDKLELFVQEIYTPYNHVYVSIYKRKNDINLPDYMFVIVFENLLLRIFIPANKKTYNIQPLYKLHYFPANYSGEMRISEIRNMAGVTQISSEPIIAGTVGSGANLTVSILKSFAD